MSIRFSRLIAIGLIAALAGCASKQQVSTGPQVAADTSRTIDLTHPATDMWDRIRRGYAIPNLRTPLVDKWTDYYARNARSVSVMSERATKYLYYIVGELERRGMPTELALLPFVESAYNPEAYSHAHASGLWQFIPGTANDFNLEQNWWQDQRRDPIASTHAALDYLEYLYEFQGDWYLALASYNWGQGSVRRAMEKNENAGLGTDYLALRMPDETANYVPKLQAIKNIITEPQKYGIMLPHAYNEPYFTTITHNDHIDIHVAAQLAEMPLEEFKFLNPSHKRDTIPAHSATLILPKDKADIFAKNIREHQGRLSTWDAYRPRAGESYAEIAQRHNMDLQQLRAINGLGTKQHKAISSQPLLVAAATTDTLNNEVIADPLGAQLAALSSQDTTVTRSQAPTQLTHIVRKGETLYRIARQYNTTVPAIQQINQLKSTHISPGTRLRLPGSNS